MIRPLSLIFIGVLCAAQLASQTPVRVPMDTIATDDPETHIILYTDNTWSYHRPALRTLDNLPIYNKNWDNTQVFAYKNIELRDLPAIISLPLVGAPDEFHYPIRGMISSRYGPRGRRNHNGVDIPLRTGEPIYASFDGRVRYARYNGGGFGNLVIIRHPNGLETWHAHLSKLNVGADDYVKAGQVIGFGGNTGRSRGAHLHFEMRYCDQAFDPERIIDFENGTLRFVTYALEKSYFNIHSRASDQLDEEYEQEELLTMLSGSSPGTEETYEQVLARVQNAQNRPADSPTGASVSALTPTSGAVYHTVKSGDQLLRIAQRYGTTVAKICALNPGLERNSILQLRQRLRVK